MDSSNDQARRWVIKNKKIYNTLAKALVHNFWYYLTDTEVAERSQKIE